MLVAHEIELTRWTKHFTLVLVQYIDDPSEMNHVHRIADSNRPLSTATTSSRPVCKFSAHTYQLCRPAKSQTALFATTRVPALLLQHYRSIIRNMKVAISLSALHIRYEFALEPQISPKKGWVALLALKERKRKMTKEKTNSTKCRTCRTE